MLKFKLAAAAAFALSATAGQAVVLFDNGPVVGSNGLSVLTPPATTLGAAANAAFSLADNFTVTGTGWNVSSLDFYGYQTQAGTGAYTFTSATWSIVAGSNVNTGTVVASGTTAVTNGGLVGYRVTSTTLTDQTRAIFRLNADVTDFVLGAGNYFVTWSLAGTGVSGPFVPPVLGSLGTGNGLQGPVGGAAYVALQDAGSLQGYDVPFTINGTVAGAVPETATWAMMIGGFGMTGGAMRHRRRRTMVRVA